MGWEKQVIADPWKRKTYSYGTDGTYMTYSSLKAYFPHGPEGGVGTTSSRGLAE